MMLTQEALKELFTYDTETGVFQHRLAVGRGKVGVAAGNIHRSGYRRIKVMLKEYKAHRLAWLYVYGEWPEGQVDHINGQRDDNRIANLRDVSGTENQHNRRKPSANNQSGYLGVSLCKDTNLWRATIKVGGKNKRLGLYDTPQQAHEAYLAAKAKLHPTSPMHMYAGREVSGPPAVI